MTLARIPISTCRIQFNPQFRFVDCRDLVPYLYELGVTDVYASPRSRANRGSSHGYDVANPARVNSELGTEDEFDDLCERLKQYSMGMLLDIVPNHMAASHENPWWMDVLENGPGSPYAHYFDINWQPATSKAAFLQENRVLLPVLGDLYGRVLENQELSLRIDESGFHLTYYERKLPLDPKTYGPILHRCEAKVAALPEGAAVAQEFRAIEEIASRMPARTETHPERVRRRMEASDTIKRRLFELYLTNPDARQAIDAALRDLAGTSGDQQSFNPLHAILEDQGYRLANWKIAFEDINYRRFFDINDLVSLRVEAEDVFVARHQSIIQLVKEGKITGLRVDHVDGLMDPATYLVRLSNSGRQDSGQSTYVIVEKILGRDEALPAEWQTSGTTGYDFLNALNDLFLDREGLGALEETYAQFTGERVPFEEICYAKNKQAMWKMFAGEVAALTRHLGRLAAQDRHARDVPQQELMNALVEVTACLPVYRTYIIGLDITERDRQFLERTIALARRRTPETEVTDPAFAFLRTVLLLEPPVYASEQRREYLRFVMQWQQFTGPLMAKGLEDTAFYVHNSLISRNEVGGDPLREKPPRDLGEFHRFQVARRETWPYTMNTTSTHDTKRGEDVRARLNVLTELPSEWDRNLKKWSRMNRAHKTRVNGIDVPTPAEEALIYQMLLGTWPLDQAEEGDYADRLSTFLIKALREAKVHTGWIRSFVPHEDAVVGFARAILAPDNNPFREDFLRFQPRLAWHGMLNGLSQALIRMTTPGVPDLYQGCELWNLSMVDPDNRRPVDYRKRQAMLDELRRRVIDDRHELLRDSLANWQSGLVKMYLTWQTLNFRRNNGALFLEGDYVPLQAGGELQKHAVAFARVHEGKWAVCVAPIGTTRLCAPGRLPIGRRVWQESQLILPEGAPEKWKNVLTGETVSSRSSEEGVGIALHRALRLFPVALLEGGLIRKKKS